MGFKEKYINEVYKKEISRTNAIEKSYELLLVPDMYNALDGVFDNDALYYLRKALGEQKASEIEKEIIAFYGDDHLQPPTGSPF